MNSPFDLNVRSLTWNHDSRGLFDYESKNVFKRNYRARPVNESYIISRNGSDVGMTINASMPSKMPSFCHAPVGTDGVLSPLRVPSDLDSRTDTRPLMRIFYESGQYWIDHPDRVRDPSKTLWVVIRQSKYPCILGSGDMLKMGRYKIRVREAVSDSSPPVVKNKRFSVCSTDSYDDATFADDDFADGSPGSTVDTATAHPLYEVQSVEVCRICYESGETGNPLISPCKCSGSMQYIHLKCLRRWMDGRLSTNGDAGSQEINGATTISYFWRNLDCELCKLSYPTSVECPSQTNPSGVEFVDLYELPKPDGPYIVLESNIRVPVAAPNSSTNSVSGVTLQKGLHIMSLSKSRSSVLLGRGHDADVRINDISVSRIHGTIKLVHATVNGVRKQQILIEDKGSKFGSLLGVRGPIPIEPGVPVSIQSGRTVTTVTIRKPNLLSNIIPLCFGAGQRTLANVPDASIPVLVSESSPLVDLKNILGEMAPVEAAHIERRATRMPETRGSVAETRASVASVAQEEEEELN